MKLKMSLVIGVLAVALSAVAAVGVSSAQAKTGGSYTFNYNSQTTTGVPASGQVTINQFEKVGNVIEAVGSFTGTIGTQAVTDAPFTAPVTQVDGHSLSGGALSAAAAADSSCQILSLTLGPLHLNVLGLVVDLNQVNLNITAQQGSGNLLGNLLCSVAHLLDNTGGGTGGLSGLLQQLTSLLNQILAQL
jgi:hypothetical protein